ncbi:hypothetical protein ABZ318_17905 [Streptomyces sp. NPDC006197]|uniref:hypothetical protein n=1 Tax=Streptomyces sp. NPDC006197 TaxID=3156685 RepID=UPI0033A4AEB5
MLEAPAQQHARPGPAGGGEGVGCLGKHGEAQNARGCTSPCAAFAEDLLGCFVVAVAVLGRMSMGECKEEPGVGPVCQEEQSADGGMSELCASV